MTTGTGSSKPVLIGSGDEQRLASDAPFEQPQRDACVRSKEYAKILELINLLQLTSTAVSEIATSEELQDG
ncbi:hypothetical protein WJX75_003244 [Coccomyxa subellipsoidea]|uniref:Uncharacterized protein n=1 Tax=Coccomyxa subellipsoidea TaxID=248742 RepID=A0ABR2YMZ9_9CHLO